MRASLALLVTLLAGGCSERPPPPTPPLVAGTQDAAAARVRGFLSAYQAADAEAALTYLCTPDDDARAFLTRSLAPGSPFRITGYELSGVTALWDDQQRPLYLVGVRFPSRVGPPIEHGYRVRAREGCLESFFKDARRAPEPASEAPAHPLPAPSEGNVDDDGPQPGTADQGAWGPPLPAAPTGDGDVVLDL